ncbi:hypothetical protein V3C99_014691 [Haemonchus contortus]
MYSSDLYTQGDITSILPPYEIEPNGIIVAGEEVVYNSANKDVQVPNVLTKDYALLGEDANQSDSSGVLYGRMDLKVSVVRKVDAESPSTSQWFPKKVIIVTDKRQIESMAWAHSSSDLMSCSSSTEISCPIESDSRTDISMDSDPSLSSINAPQWYSTQNTSLPSTSSANSTDGFQLSSIEIEPDIDTGSLRSRSPENTDDTDKVMDNEGKFGIEIRQFKVPVKVYPKNTRHRKSQPVRDSESSGFPCLVEGCTSILKTRTALRKHAKVHAARNFSCDRCGRTFAERTKLKRHMLTHTGERAFQCQFDGCSKAFSLESNLKSHIKTHTGEKPHKCQFCHHAFSHPYNLRVHISRRHKEQNTV